MIAPIRVCHLLSGDLWAGAEAVAWQMLKGLSRLPEVGVEAIVLNRGELLDRIRALGIPSMLIEEDRHGFPSLLRRATTCLGGRRIDILHAHRYKENLLGYCLARRFRKGRLVTTVHGLPETGGKGWRYRVTMEVNYRLLARSFDRVVAVSCEIEDALVRRYGMRPERIGVIRNGIEAIRPVSPRRRRHGRFVVGSLGRLVPVKDYGLMVETARLMAAGGDDVGFILGGDGPETDRIRRLVAQAGLSDRFLLPGLVEDVDRFYEEIDLFLNTSRHEGIPVSVLEAMSRGIPVVAPAVGGLPEVLDDDVHGFLVREREPAAFVAPCRKLFRDAPLWERMSAAAADRVAREFSCTGMAGRYRDLYRTLNGEESGWNGSGSPGRGSAGTGR